MATISSRSGDNAPTIIVGAGLGGLSFALSLAKLGLRAHVLEAASTLGEAGAGISLPPNALKILWRLGLRESLAPLLSVPEYGEIRRGDTGELLGKTPFGKPLVEQFGAPFAQVHRADLHGCLLEAVNASSLIEVSTNARVIACEPGDEQVNVQLANGKRLSAPAVVGCDGIRSTVRSLLFDTGSPRFTRHVAWRCLIPMETLPAHLRERRSMVHLTDYRQLVHYPVRNLDLLNCVAFTGDMDWSIESWNEPGDVDELISYFSHFTEDCLAVLNAIPRDACHRWAIYDRDPITCWTHGRVALLGDAAHPMPPYLGQGAAMAIEDGIVLATALHESATVQDAFTVYETTRVERANQSLHESRLAGHRFQDPGADASRFDGDQALQTKKMFAYVPESPLLTY